MIKDCDLTNEYCAQLTDYLADKSVLSVDGMQPFESPWLTHKAKIMGLDIKGAQYLPIKKSQLGKITCDAMVLRDERSVKILYRVHGNNNLPNKKG